MLATAVRRVKIAAEKETIISVSDLTKAINPWDTLGKVSKLYMYNLLMK